LPAKRDNVASLEMGERKQEGEGKRGGKWEDKVK